MRTRRLGEMESEVFAFCIGASIGLICGAKIVFALLDADTPRKKADKKSDESGGRHGS